MRDYGKLYSTFWTSATTRGLSDRAKLLAVYLLSGPHTNMLGCFRLPDGYIVEDLGWRSETVSKGFGELFRKGFATRDEASKWVLVTKFLRWNPIENPNQGKSAARLFEQIPNDLDIKADLASILEQPGSKFPQTVLERFRNGSGTVSKPFRNQEQEQEQEPEQEAGDSSDDGEAPPSEKKKRARKPDPLFDAVAEVTRSDPKVSATFIAKVRHALADAEPPYSPEEVRDFGRRYKALCNWATSNRSDFPTLGELQKYIGRVRDTRKADDYDPDLEFKRQEMERLKREREERAKLGDAHE